jgi:hypothetical protein
VRICVTGFSTLAGLAGTASTRDRRRRRRDLGMRRIRTVRNSPRAPWSRMSSQAAANERGRRGPESSIVRRSGPLPSPAASPRTQTGNHCRREVAETRRLAAGGVKFVAALAVSRGRCGGGLPRSLPRPALGPAPVPV